MDWKPAVDCGCNGCYKSTEDSFIFSFTDRNNLQTAKVSYPNNGKHQCSIYCYPNNGPTFGGGNDLACYGNDGSWRHNPYTYSIGIDIPYTCLNKLITIC